MTPMHKQALMLWFLCAALSNLVLAGNAASTAEQLQRARSALEARDYALASDLFLAVLREEPALASARTGYALSELKLGRSRQALDAVLDGLVRDPKQPALLELLGDLRNAEERVEEALRSWREAFAIAPSDRVREKILLAERELNAGQSYALSLTPHFNLRFDGKLDQDLAREVMAYLEGRFWVVADALAHAPPQPITVLLYPHKQFKDVTQSAEGIGGLYDGKIRVPLGGLARLHPGAERVLVHELAHAVIHSKTRGHCPRWLHEGLAQMSEPRPLLDRERRQVAALLQAGGVELEDPQGFSYPAALSLTLFLESWRGRAGLAELLDHLGQGQPLDSALKELYGSDFAGIRAQWAESVLAGDDP